MPLDGYESPVTIRSQLTIRGGKVTIDYTGTSPASIFGINSPRTYTHAYSVFGLKAVIAPHVPNNIGSLSCFDLVTEAGSCVDPTRPSPVTARHVIGQMLADSVFGCLAQALPGKVQAESAGAIWILSLNSAHGRVPAHVTAKAKQFGVISIALGGVGGRPGKDGLATTAFPSGIGAIPVEITENQCPLYFRHKEYLTNSGGAGEWRGGLSQRIEVANRGTHPLPSRPPRLTASVCCPGAGWRRTRRQGQCAAWQRKRIARQGHSFGPAGDSLIVELPGGGGFGDPHAEPERVEKDLKSGLVSPCSPGKPWH